MVSQCCLYKANLDSTAHIFLHCGYAMEVWNSISTTFRINLDTSGDFVEFFQKALSTLSINKFLICGKLLLFLEFTQFGMQSIYFLGTFGSTFQTISEVWRAMQEVKSLQLGSMHNYVDNYKSYALLESRAPFLRP